MSPDYLGAPATPFSGLAQRMSPNAPHYLCSRTESIELNILVDLFKYILYYYAVNRHFCYDHNTLTVCVHSNH